METSKEIEKIFSLFQYNEQTFLTGMLRFIYFSKKYDDLKVLSIIKNLDEFIYEIRPQGLTHDQIVRRKRFFFLTLEGLKEIVNITSEPLVIDIVRKKILMLNALIECPDQQDIIEIFITTKENLTINREENLHSNSKILEYFNVKQKFLEEIVEEAKMYHLNSFKELLFGECCDW